MTAASGSAIKVTLLSDLELAMERDFDAPRDLVYAAFTQGEHLRHWWGPKGTTLPACEVDFREGGAWHMVVRGGDGNDNGFRGAFRDITPPERFTWTFEWEGMPGQIGLETFHFSEKDGKTTVRTVSHFNSIEERDAVLNSGMEAGANESYERLDAHLATLAPAH